MSGRQDETGSAQLTADLRRRARDAAQRSAELQLESAAVQAQSRQALRRAREVFAVLGRQTDLQVATCWVDAWNRRDAEALAGLADAAVIVHPSLVSRRQEHYDGHDGLRQWMHDLSQDEPCLLIRVDEFCARRPRAVFMDGQLLLQGDPLSSYGTLLEFDGDTVSVVHSWLSDPATLQYLGHIGATEPSE